MRIFPSQMEYFWPKALGTVRWLPTTQASLGPSTLAGMSRFKNRVDF